MYLVNQYQSKPINFPSHDIPFDQRGKQWYAKFCEAVYSQYLRDGGSIAYSERREMKLNRLYAQGNQPVNKYRDIICPKDDKTGDR